MKLRPAQEAIVAYDAGRLAVSAVPGSGKTFTLSLLAAKLLAQGYAGENAHLDPAQDQRVLIVTYLNASVDTFRARIRQRLEELNLPPDRGYDVRTLHSLALEIVRLSESGLGGDTAEPTVTDDTQTALLVNQALDNWIEAQPEVWQAFGTGDNPREQARWRSTLLRTARDFIRAAKNERYRAQDIQAKLAVDRDGQMRETGDTPDVQNSPLLYMLAGIYEQYQMLLNRQGLLDFDDLIWHATDLLESRPDLVETLRMRWPFVLEDEAQDSVPLQEVLLQNLTGPEGNWVRVGDPNQAIMSTFTAAHPRFFNAFIDRDDVTALPLPNSGRSSPQIMGAANALVDWAVDQHPVPQVREHAFRRQHILPTPPGDAQPNPTADDSWIRLKVYKHRDSEELPAVAALAAQYAQKHPGHTLAILVPTHSMGYIVADRLDELEASYDNLLRSGTREREIATAINAILAVLANPQDKKASEQALLALQELGHPAARIPEEALPKLTTLVRSVQAPESFLFPWDEESFRANLPSGVATDEELRYLERFAGFLRTIFDLRSLPVDDLALALGDELFAYDEARESDLAIAYQLAIVLRYWHEMNPEWRLPELSAELGHLASGRRSLPLRGPRDYGYEPQPGRITLTTQHSAKGLEWDAVFMVGNDSVWIPGDLDGHFYGVIDEYGGNLTAEALAQLHALMQGDAGLHPGLTATESANVDLICERLRLFYVGITRARRILHISRSRSTGPAGREKPAQPATVLALLYHYLKSIEDKQA